MEGARKADASEERDQSDQLGFRVQSSRWRTIKRFDKAWRHVCKTAGLVNFHYHDLRHTYCSNLLLSGTDMKLASGMIGHKYESMTDDTPTSRRRLSSACAGEAGSTLRS